MHGKFLMSLVALGIGCVSPASESKWCDDFTNRVRYGDSGLVYDNELAGWGAIYDYLETENTALANPVLGKPIGHPVRITLYSAWKTSCAGRKPRSDHALQAAMSTMLDQLIVLSRRPVPKPDMSVPAHIELSRSASGVWVKASRPLTHAELVGYTRQIASHYRASSLKGVIFQAGSWRMKTKLYPDRSVRVIGNGSSTIYR